MFTKILIANRGEIACRVIKTARAMGILTVAVYSDADADSLHVSMADEAIHLGGSPSRESYLLGDKVIEAAIRTGAQAIHPGYGFLSENANFAKILEERKIKFIGPSSKLIKMMGNKIQAKKIAKKSKICKNREKFQKIENLKKISNFFRKLSLFFSFSKKSMIFFYLLHSMV